MLLHAQEIMTIFIPYQYDEAFWVVAIGGLFLIALYAGIAGQIAAKAGRKENPGQWVATLWILALIVFFVLYAMDIVRFG